MPTKEFPSKLVLGMLLAILALIVIAFFMLQSTTRIRIPGTIASLRHSIKEHEVGVYNGIYTGVSAGEARTR